MSEVPLQRSVLRLPVPHLVNDGLQGYLAHTKKEIDGPTEYSSGLRGMLWNLISVIADI